MTRREELFATEYDQLIYFIRDNKKDVIVECKDKTEVNKIAWRFYEYRKLLQKSKEVHRRALGTQADYIMLTKEANQVIFRDRRFSRESVLLREALNKVGANELKPAVLPDQIPGLDQPPDSTDSASGNRTIVDLYGVEPEEKK